jgi:hypothetical protein
MIIDLGSLKLNIRWGKFLNEGALSDAVLRREVVAHVACRAYGYSTAWMVDYWHWGETSWWSSFHSTIVSNHYTECSPALHSIRQKGFLFKREHTNTFPCYHTELLGVCACQFWRWTSLSNAVTYFSAVLSRVLKTHEECCNMLLNPRACNSGAGTAAQERVLHHPAGRHMDDNTC